MTCLSEFIHDLKTHKNLCEDILKLVGNEHARLRSSDENPGVETSGTQKKILAQLTESLNKIREKWTAMLKFEPAQRQEHPEIAELLRQNQNLIMGILV